MQSEEFFVGLTHVTLPTVRGGVTAYKIDNVGVTVGQESALGWQAHETVYAPPEKCQFIIIVRSDVSAKNAGEVISKIGGENPCVVDFSKK